MRWSIRCCVSVLFVSVFVAAFHGVSSERRWSCYYAIETCDNVIFGIQVIRKRLFVRASPGQQLLAIASIQSRKFSNLRDKVTWFQMIHKRAVLQGRSSWRLLLIANIKRLFPRKLSNPCVKVTWFQLIYEECSFKRAIHLGVTMAWCIIATTCQMDVQ